LTAVNVRRRDAQQRRSSQRAHEAIRIGRVDHPEGQVSHKDKRGHRRSRRAGNARSGEGDRSSDTTLAAAHGAPARFRAFLCRGLASARLDPAAALAITNAIARLIKAATDSQQEIVAQGKGANSTQQFYKRNNRWTEGLISAARSVAFATNLLIETADGVLSGTHSLEQLIVASNEVAGSTAQLVAASRVKANLMSKTQERLELAAKAVTEACKALVKLVRAISAKQVVEEDVDYRNMAGLEFKKREMEQQVEILRLEKDLGAARHRLGAMRRAGYHTDETDYS
jgi:hypothetical protein